MLVGNIHICGADLKLNNQIQMSSKLLRGCKEYNRRGLFMPEIVERNQWELFICHVG